MQKDKEGPSITPIAGAKLALSVAKMLVKASPISQVSILVDTAELILNILEVRMVFLFLRNHLATLIMMGAVTALGVLNLPASKVKHRSA